MTAHIGLDARELSARDTYRLLTSCLVPRPIAWVSSVNALGQGNLAPFSFYTMVSTEPPLIALSISQHQGQEKDTAANILETEEFVVNFVTLEQLAPMHASSGRYPPDVDEAQLLGVDMVASARVRPRGVARSPVRLECILAQALTFGVRRAHLLVGEVVQFSVAESCMSDGRIDAALLDPACRLGGPWYAGLGPRIFAGSAQSLSSSE